MKARIASTYELFHEDSIVPQSPANKKQKVVDFTTDTADDGSTIVRSKMNDGMSSILLG